jgi:hypothetical protein
MGRLVVLYHLLFLACYNNTQRDRVQGRTKNRREYVQHRKAVLTITFWPQAKSCMTTIITMSISPAQTFVQELCQGGDPGYAP